MWDKIGSSEKLEFSGQLLSYLERCKIKNTSIFFLEDKTLKSRNMLTKLFVVFFKRL